MKNLKFTLVGIPLGAASLGAVKEVLKELLVKGAIEGALLVYPIVVTSVFLVFYFLGRLLGGKLEWSILVANPGTTFMVSFISVFFFVIYSEILNNTLLESIFTSILLSLIVSLLIFFSLKIFYRKNINKILE